jgi:hypothetical protein
MMGVECLWHLQLVTVQHLMVKSDAPVRHVKITVVNRPIMSLTT